MGLLQQRHRRRGYSGCAGAAGNGPASDARGGERLIRRGLAGGLAALAALSGCATAKPPTEPGIAGLGKTVTVGPVQVTPYAVLEDSRCPQAVNCVWAGRVRVAVRLSLDAREMTLGQPVPVPGGALMLVEVLPPRQPESAIAPADYRFRFRFDAAPPGAR